MYKVSATRKKMPLKWRNLTKYQKLHISNGCGKKGGWFNPPDFLFTASCNQHDFNYWLGKVEEDRKKADLQFYERMKVDASTAGWYIKWWHYSMACTYYRAVRMFGKDSFYDGKKSKTWNDLERDINKALSSNGQEAALSRQ